MYVSMYTYIYVFMFDLIILCLNPRSWRLLPVSEFFLRYKLLFFSTIACISLFLYGQEGHVCKESC